MQNLSYLFAMLVISCTSQFNAQNNPQSSGAFSYTIKFYDTLTRQYSNETIFPIINIWQRNNLFIEEIRTVETYTDTNGIMTRKTPTAYYLFIDRKSKRFFHYSSFSDTATILEKYTLSDTAMMRGVGGWAFYQNWDIEIVGDSKILNDTTINKVAYKRTQLPIKSNNFLTTIIAYQRCDKIGSVLQFDRNLEKKLGCPVTRIDYQKTSVDPIPMSLEITFLRDSLSQKEDKFFDVWEKNIAKYPINK